MRLPFQRIGYSPVSLLAEFQQANDAVAVLWAAQNYKLPQGSAFIEL